MLLPLQTFAFDRGIRIFCDKLAEAKREAGLTGPGGVIGSALGVGAMGPHQARGKTMEYRRPEGAALARE